MWSEVPCICKRGLEWCIDSGTEVCEEGTAEHTASQRGQLKRCQHVSSAQLSSTAQLNAEHLPCLLGAERAGCVCCGSIRDEVSSLV
jgi:hypothetical protein